MSLYELEEALNNREYCPFHKDFFNDDGICEKCQNFEPMWTSEEQIGLLKPVIYVIISLMFSLALIIWFT